MSRGSSNPKPRGSCTVTALKNGDEDSPTPELQRVRTVERTRVDVDGTVINYQEIVHIFSDGSQKTVGEVNKITEERVKAHFLSLKPRTLVLCPGVTPPIVRPGTTPLHMRPGAAPLAMFPSAEAMTTMPTGMAVITAPEPTPVRTGPRVVKQNKETAPLVVRVYLTLRTVLDTEDPTTQDPVRRSVLRLLDTEDGRKHVATMTAQPNVTTDEEVMKILRTHKLAPKKQRKYGE